MRRKWFLFGASCLAAAVMVPVLLLSVSTALDLSEKASVIVASALTGIIVGVLVVTLLRE